MPEPQLLSQTLHLPSARRLPACLLLDIETRPLNADYLCAGDLHYDSHARHIGCGSLTRQPHVQICRTEDVHHASNETANLASVPHINHRYAT